jgi:hypothetical protein
MTDPQPTIEDVAAHVAEFVREAGPDSPVARLVQAAFTKARMLHDQGCMTAAELDTLMGHLMHVQTRELAVALADLFERLPSFDDLVQHFRRLKPESAG